MKFDSAYENLQPQILDDLADVVIDILAKKLPSDVTFPALKLDTVSSKIKLVPIPKDIFEEDIKESKYDEVSGEY